MLRKLLQQALFGLLVCGITLSGCRSNTTDSSSASTVELRQYSVTPTFVSRIAQGVQAFTLISSDDTLRQSPNFVFGGMADGAGLLRNPDGTFTFVCNHEDNFAVSRITLDQTFRPVRGEYLMTSNDGLWRLCSATMVTPEVHGVARPQFITCGESGPESQIHIVDPYGRPSETDRILTNFGYWSGENAVTLPKGTYPNRTVTIIGDDDFQGAGEVALYVGEGTGNFDNGKLYVMARRDNVRRERSMVAGQVYEVEFREITNPKSRAAAEFNQEAARLNAIAFGRVEDLDYRKGSDAAATEIYFCVTGQVWGTGANADSARTMYGRVYRLRLDPSNPLRGTLEVLFDGDDPNGPAREFMNPDNICVTENFVYIQEDPNRYRGANVFDARRQNHDCRIYQWRIGSSPSTISVFLEVSPPRDGSAAQRKYVAERNPDGSATNWFVGSDGRPAIGEWEYGAMLDISNEVGRPGTFLVCVQTHTWRQGGQAPGRDFRNPDGGTLPAAQVPTNFGEGSYVLILTNVPR
ncbi:MAG: hypothetical protein RMI34_12725 [Chloroherpetonaceae bacterium]|nr:PhoX family protein [Chloroherpetonaceae bacterium]MCS7210657.1 PhoX family protein [Chloroherpetonaceae bacterium]MDW8020922.1 hypothetical protein [Chloroherpetonaceae bacterium]